MTPIHNWSRVDAHWFHHFRLQWICALTDALNQGLLTDPDFALIASSFNGRDDATKLSRIAIQRGLGNLVAVLDIVSPEMKQSHATIESFIQEAVRILRAKVQLLIIDLFPPTSRDPQGLHQLLWERCGYGSFQLPANKPLMLAAYSTGSCITAYIEPVAAGDMLPDMPLFLTADRHVPTPLAATYETTWNVCPKPLKNAVLAAAAK